MAIIVIRKAALSTTRLCQRITNHTPRTKHLVILSTTLRCRTYTMSDTRMMPGARFTSRRRPPPSPVETPTPTTDMSRTITTYITTMIRGTRTNSRRTIRSLRGRLLQRTNPILKTPTPTETSRTTSNRGTDMDNHNIETEMGAATGFMATHERCSQLVFGWPRTLLLASMYHSRSTVSLIILIISSLSVPYWLPSFSIAFPQHCVSLQQFLTSVFSWCVVRVQIGLKFGYFPFILEQD